MNCQCIIIDIMNYIKILCYSVYSGTKVKIQTAYYVAYCQLPQHWVKGCSLGDRVTYIDLLQILSLEMVKWFDEVLLDVVF